uniref:Uncharacterized protein n=1 Tax=Caenorhabditis japonica TaxID=281687 RepID=A0A8R1IG98_CAEJA
MVTTRSIAIFLTSQCPDAGRRPSYKLAGLVKETSDELMESVYGCERDPEALNEKFKIENQNSFCHRLAYAEAQLVLQQNCSLNGWLLKSVEDSSINGRSLKMLKKMKDGIEDRKYGNWTKDEVRKIIPL